MGVERRGPGMRRLDWRRFGRCHTRLYEKLGGRLVDRLGSGRRVLLLRTTGRRSALRRTTPLVFMRYQGGYVIFASNGGRETKPGWLFNIEASPDDVEVQVRDEIVRVSARVASPEERVEIRPLAEDYNAHWRQYLVYVQREIPFLILTPC